MATTGLRYRDVGVDLDAKERLVDGLFATMRRTYGPRVMQLEGGFAGLFRLDYQERLFARNFREPVLVSCTDGVGSKVLVGLQARRLRTLGIDLVAMCVNDMLCCGAEPLFFLDYLAVHRLDAEQVGELVSGIADGCKEAGCSLIGGETAELPEIYREGELDMAGFAVGVVERSRVITGRNIEPGDAVLGLTSNGLHSNGYTLARRVLLEEVGHSLDDFVPQFRRTIADELLRPTRVYARSVVRLLRKYVRKRPIRGIAHITGGGLAGNIRRILPPGLGVVLRHGSWPVPPIFEYLEAQGVPSDEMFRVFNMGLGLVLIVRPAFADAVVGHLRKLGEVAVVLGRVRRSSQAVEFR